MLKVAESWEEVERGLADHGLVLREKGGGFVVTDGEREVKASAVGRDFSRSHLEESLGQYPKTRARKAVEGTLPVTPAPAAEPEPATRQPEQLTLPLTAPAAPEARATETRAAPRFTLYDDGTFVGVRDREGQVFFTETRERALAEVERANAIAALDPDMSVRRLRAMDDQWWEAHGWPQHPEPEGRSIVGPEESANGLSPSPPPVARVQHEPPTAPASTPWDDARTQLAERAPAPVAPAWGVGDATHPPDPVGIPPVRKRTRPDSDRERYRIVLRAFKDELAALYSDPRAARRAFDASLAAASPEDAARVLAATPAKFGRLRLVAGLRRLPEAGHQAELYARWQTDRTRLDARYVAAAFLRAVAVEEAEAVLWEARSASNKPALALSRIAQREREADDDERMVGRLLREIYDQPTRAQEQLQAYRRANGYVAVLTALSKSPERFGPLCTELKPVLGIPLIPDTRKARGEASTSAALISGALKAIADRPTHEEYARAEEAMRQADAKVDAARKARDALGPATALDSVRDGLKRFDAAGRGSADRTERLDRQVTSMVSSSARPVVRGLMEKINQQHERERAREQRRTLGPDIV